jgi:hypothetical protein
MRTPKRRVSTVDGDEYNGLKVERIQKDQKHPTKTTVLLTMLASEVLARQKNRTAGNTIFDQNGA